MKYSFDSKYILAEFQRGLLFLSADKRHRCMLKAFFFATFAFAVVRPTL